MGAAYRFGQQSLAEHASRYSRHDFTLPQLFACLVPREHQKKSYRGVEALLRDCPEWCAAIGMSKPPDHATPRRTLDLITKKRNLDELFDRMAAWARKAKLLGDTLAIDSTQLDVHYRGRHHEQRRRHFAKSGKRSANARRSRSAKRTPKLAVGVDCRCHLVLAVRARTGMGSDAPDFAPALREARQRNRRPRRVLADSGYDSHANHRVARQELGVRSLIKANVGRPAAKPPASKYRRRMKRELAGSQAGKPYGQRAQVETFNSMFKRNMTDSLRCRTTARRRELALRAVVHNLAIIRSRKRRVETEPLRPRFTPPSPFLVPDEKPRNDMQDDPGEGQGRTAFRLHPGTRSHGCITIPDKDDCRKQYDEMRKLIDGTKTETTTDEKYDEDIKKYGDIIVINQPPPTSQP